MVDKLYPYFKLDALNNFVVWAIGLFSMLTIIYSLRFMKERQNLLLYYLYIILTTIASIGAVLANNLILLLVFWGFLGFTLYLLINMNGQNSSLVAKKTLIIVGGSDALMLLGIVLIYYLSLGSMDLDKIFSLGMDKIRLDLNNGLSVAAYLLIAIACFAKAGAMPFHSWIPDCAEHAPVPVVAFLPASLDKLLGIYLLARISLNLFVMTPIMNKVLMIVGAFTVIAAVMMALVQHNMKRLLGYHAVSQVGYMVLGIGTGVPIGIAGGIFHMLNHAIYKSCLFLTAGNVEYNTHTSELDKLGGLAKIMPLTYISCLIASLSISGVPPFNGFVSKWMVYQGLINQLQASGSRLQAIIPILCLVAAMFGSGLTLASFMKLLHATYLGQANERNIGKRLKEVPFTMWLPCIILAFICIIFGVFANQIPLEYFIRPIVKELGFIGTWVANSATLLIVTGLIFGVLIFKLKNLAPVYRQDTNYIGAETAGLEKLLDENRLTGTEFYNTVKDLGLLKAIYKKAQNGVFDIYEQGKKITFFVSGAFQYLHNGVLPTYLVWCLLGMLCLFYYLFFK
jgi:formate hydrogenlyase subunit 3/multisubunit Na+/H+ antiporter MnhD subunit